jgi:excinuclease ABC subunit C
MKEALPDLHLKLRTLPESPGVYQYFDKNDVVIYVGKAKNLKKRILSYFKATHENFKTHLLVKQIVRLEYTVVETELDALLLENNLIKKHQPKYNIQLKDDKTYPWICIKKEAFPRVFSTRRIVRDGSEYFGPYPNVNVMRILLNLIKEVYPLRSCSFDLSRQKIEKKSYKVCLEYHIGNCMGACEAFESETTYLEYVSQIRELLKGNIKNLIGMLQTRMQNQAATYHFEEAHATKIKLDALEKFRAKSTVVSSTVKRVDVCTLLNDSDRAFVNYFSVHDGAIIQAYTTEIRKKLNESTEAILSYVLPELLQRFESNTREVITDVPLDLGLKNISIYVPLRGDKKELIALSQRNTWYYRQEKLKQEKIKDPERHTTRILEQLKHDFRLKELPVHIECFDNSNFQGTNAVSACVVFRSAKPSKKDYRHFNVKTVEGANDFATMEEVVYRRYHRMLEEQQALPQLIIIDGGKGQLSAALVALKKLDLRGKVAICGIAKRLEEIYFPGDNLPIYLDKRSESLKVIQHLRNEAHRFGIKHHRTKRSKQVLSSEILDIKGIGLKTQTQLMRHFKTISAIKSATVEQLTQVIGPAKAMLIKHACF